MAELPPQIVFRRIDSSEADEARIRSKVSELERLFHRLINCRVVIEQRNSRQHKGNTYNARIYIGVPGQEIVVTNDHPRDQGHENMYDAIGDAFEAAEKRLKTYAAKLEGEVKTHEILLHGKILRLFGEDGYGFIETSEGEEIYFHKNSVVQGSFNTLEEGDEVRLSVAPENNARGPQASSVSLVGRHHLHPE